MIGSSQYAKQLSNRKIEQSSVSTNSLSETFLKDLRPYLISWIKKKFTFMIWKVRLSCCAWLLGLLDPHGNYIIDNGKFPSFVDAQPYTISWFFY